MFWCPFFFLYLFYGGKIHTTENRLLLGVQFCSNAHSRRATITTPILEHVSSRETKSLSVLNDDFPSVPDNRHSTSCFYRLENSRYLIAVELHNIDPSVSDLFHLIASGLSVL